MVRSAVVLIALVAACGSSKPAPRAVNGKLEMRSYFLVLLRRGPAWSPEQTPESKKLFEGHMANINAMADTGKLLIAGPTEADKADKTAIAGIFIFDVPSKQEVIDLMKGDPAIEAGRLVPEVLEWYGPANISYPGQVGPNAPKPKGKDKPFVELE